MQARLEETERIVAELQSGLAPVTHTPVHVRFEKAMDTVRMTGEVHERDFGNWLDGAYAQLFGALTAAEIAPAGPTGALYSPEISDEALEPIEAFVPISAPFRIPPEFRDVTIGEVPAAWVAVLVHVGAYETVGDTYRTLGAWVARNAEHAGERIREWYVVSYAETPDPAAFRTEIAWPIKRNPGVAE
jgi:effector-binding domain-containing protein